MMGALSCKMLQLLNDIIFSASQPARQGSMDEETRQKLEKRLSERPDKNELVERNILKGMAFSSRSKL